MYFLKKSLSILFATTAAAAGLYFAGYTYADAATVTVKAGDTVAKLASEYNDTVSGVQQKNGLKNVNFITVGQQLQVGADSASTTATNYNYSAPKTTTTNYSYSAPKTNYKTSYTYSAPKTNYSYTNNASSKTSSYISNTSGSDASAKAWIANRESGGSYSATNGQYIGKYQLSSSYLNGDYSAANQEKVADNYVSSRYGSWSAAKSFWQANGWY